MAELITIRKVSRFVLTSHRANAIVWTPSKGAFGDENHLEEKHEDDMSSQSAKDILILSFDPVEQRTLMRVLRRKGYEPRLVNRAEEVIEELRTKPPALLLLDAALSGRGAQYLVREPALNDIPIGLLGPKPAGETVFHWVHACLHRPARPRQIDAFVERLLYHEDDLAATFASHMSSQMTPPPPTEKINPRLVRVRENLLEILWPSLTSQLSAKFPALGASELSESVAAGLRDILDTTALLQLSRVLHNIKPGVEVLRGDLGTISTPELLQLVVMQRQTGIFEVVSGEQKAELFFVDGRLQQVLGEMGGATFLIGQILMRLGTLHMRNLRPILQSHNQDPARPPIGQKLTELGYLTPDVLQKALTIQSSELMYELMRWETGTFSFCRLPKHAVELQKVADLGLQVEPLMMEGLRRVDEWALIEKKIHPHIVFHSTMKPRDDSPLQPDEAQVLALVDGRKDVATMIEESHQSPFWVSKNLLQLLQARLIIPA